MSRLASQCLGMNLKPKVRLQTRFSSIFTLEKGKVFTADNPIVMYERKTFALCYKALSLQS